MDGLCTESREWPLKRRSIVEAARLRACASRTAGDLANCCIAGGHRPLRQRGARHHDTFCATPLGCKMLHSLEVLKVHSTASGSEDPSKNRPTEFVSLRDHSMAIYPVARFFNPIFDITRACKNTKHGKIPGKLVAFCAYDCTKCKPLHSAEWKNFA